MCPSLLFRVSFKHKFQYRNDTKVVHSKCFQFNFIFLNDLVYAAYTFVKHQLLVPFLHNTAMCFKITTLSQTKAIVLRQDVKLSHTQTERKKKWNNSFGTLAVSVHCIQQILTSRCHFFDIHNDNNLDCFYL